jgi:hypothetical protein
LTETAKLGRVLLRLSDTAGLRESGDVVEKIGIDRARREAENAELILAVFDGSRLPDESDEDFVSYLETLSGVKVALINKSDLGLSPEMAKLSKRFDYTCQISAETGNGFDALEILIEQLYIDEHLDTSNDAIISNARQAAAVSSAIEALTIASDAIRGDLPLEICCAEVENALSALTVADCDDPLPKPIRERAKLTELYFFHIPLVALGKQYHAPPLTHTPRDPFLKGISVKLRHARARVGISYISHQLFGCTLDKRDTFFLDKPYG